MLPLSFLACFLTYLPVRRPSLPLWLFPPGPPWLTATKSQDLLPLGSTAGAGCTAKSPGVPLSPSFYWSCGKVTNASRCIEVCLFLESLQYQRPDKRKEEPRSQGLYPVLPSGSMQQTFFSRSPVNAGGVSTPLGRQWWSWPSMLPVRQQYMVWGAWTSPPAMWYPCARPMEAVVDVLSHFSLVRRCCTFHRSGAYGYESSQVHKVAGLHVDSVDTQERDALKMHEMVPSGSSNPSQTNESPFPSTCTPVLPPPLRR